MKEYDIRPADLFNEYLKLCAQDANIYFKDSSSRAYLPCPACDSKNVKPVFEKWGFGYVCCEECGTLYQSPRPPKAAFARFYQESPSAKYWANTFFPAVAEARRVNLFRPKVGEIEKLCRDHNFLPNVVADIGAGYGLFLEEWRTVFPDSKLIAIEPNKDLAEVCRTKKLKVIESFVEDMADDSDPIDLLIAFELIEHVYDPLEFCIAVKKLISPKGKILLTGLTVDGFDIQILWNQSRSVFPPHHINFMSVCGVEQLFLRAGFTDISVFTPGKLDVDILRNALNEGFELSSDLRFVKTLFKRGDEALNNFQRFLSEHKLSSHFWVWASV